MEYNLYLIMLGATVPGRLTEQHDVFIGIAPNLFSLVPNLKKAWTQAGARVHIDAWRKVNFVDGYQVSVVEKLSNKEQEMQLFLVNLGGYLPNVFEELHCKLLIVAKDKASAIRNAKQSDFYKENSFKGALSHIDDKYGVDVDEVYAIEDILSPEDKMCYSILLTPTEVFAEDSLHIGYLKLDKIKEDSNL